MINKDVMVIRESIGNIVSMLTNRAIKVTQRGSRAYVAYHPKTGAIVGMNIPYIPDDADDNFISAIQGFLDHEVGHVLHSDPEVLIKSKSYGDRVMNMTNIIEDVYVERKMTEGFRGSGVNLESVRKFYLEKIARVKINAALATGNTEEARGIATVAAFRAWGGQTIAMDFIKEPAFAVLVAPVAAKMGELIHAIGKCDSSLECLELARKCVEKLEEKRPPPPPKADKFLDAMDHSDDLKDSLKDEDKKPAEDEGTTHVEEDDSGKTGSKESDPVDAVTSAGDDSEGAGDGDGDSEDADTDSDDTPSDSSPVEETGDGDDSEAGMSAETSGDSEAETPSDTEGSGSKTESDDEDSEPSGSGSSEPDDGLADMFDTARDFDEEVSKSLSETASKEIKSSDYAVFSREWDVIAPAPMAKNEESIKKMVDKVRDSIGVMQKSLERAMAAKARKAWNPGQVRGRIAPGSLFKTSVGDDRVFRKRFETRAKNTAVSLVIDCSGSMAHADRIGVAGTAAYTIATVLERLKITYEVIGFTSTYSGEMSEFIKQDAQAQKKRTHSMGWSRIEPIYMPVFKPFAGKLDSSALSRLAHLTERPGWLLQNIDGESVQIAARRLMQQNVERRIMLVMSDGDPACSCGDGLEPHLKKTVKEAEAQGIETVGIGIQTDAVRNFYPKHIVLNDLAELPTRVMAELTKILLN